ncbi:MAG: choice-of-anchor J domain-containing protein [Prevotella sp.]|nr:choice-of-anchor J domain-containing protein [Prevotella sp.]
MKKLTRLLSLASIMMPITLSAQNVYTWDFESEGQFNEWTIVDKDGDGFNWQYFSNEGRETGRMTPHGGEGLVFSASYDNDISSALTPDNWLISPEVNLGGVLSLWACGQDSNGYDAEVFGVYVCVGNSTNPDDFVQVGADISQRILMGLYV